MSSVLVFIYCLLELELVIIDYDVTRMFGKVEY